MNRYILMVSLLVLASFNLSFRWPVTDFIFTSSFGESRGDHYHDGIDLISKNDKVYPFNSGKLLFAWNKSLFPLENYWGGGNYKILRHDDKLLSVYMHLEDGENLQTSYSENDNLGIIGNTGHSYGKHLHFSILNQIKKESLNPLTTLPAITDTKAPEILYFYIRIGDKYIRLNENSDIRLTQHYPLLVEIHDSITGRENLGIHKIKILFNGQEFINTDFNTIGFNQNNLTVQKYAYADLFDEKGYYKISGIKYKEGINTAVVQVADYYGNSVEKIFNINVKLDMIQR